MKLSRRNALKGMGGAVVAASAIKPVWASTQVPFTIVINQSPWFASFQATVEAYEAETGNRVNLDVNPFAGSLEKQRNSVRSAEGQYDLLIMNSGWFAEMYAGGFVTPINDIDPSFKLDSDVYSLGNTIYWNEERRSATPDGKLMSVPVNPNIPMMFYRGDLYEEAGLEAPTTFAELEANAKRFHNPDEMYGIVQRGARGPHTVAYDFYPYLYGHGGGIFADQDNGDYSVTLNNDAGMQALEYYLRLAREAGHPRTEAMDQADLIQNMVTGKAAHISIVIAASSQMDDPNKSAVVGKVQYAPTPSLPGLPTAPGLGHWLAGIAHNVPDDRKAAALEFLRWYQTKEAQMVQAGAGGIPINGAVFNSPMAQEEKNRWMEPLSRALPNAVNIYQFPEAGEVVSILELGLNRAVAGELTAADAMNAMSADIHKIMSGHGYKTGLLTSK